MGKARTKKVETGGRKFSSLNAGCVSLFRLHTLFNVRVLTECVGVYY